MMGQMDMKHTNMAFVVTTPQFPSSRGRLRTSSHPVCMAKKPKKKKPPQPRKAPASTPSSSPFSGMAAGPVTSTPARRATRALGSPRKQQELPAIETKTAQDFIAEGVEDDTVDFVEEDIRFGIDDVKDPFLEREKEEKLEKEIEEGETLRKSVGSTVDVMGDGGVMKRVLAPGSGEVVPTGAKVRVNYQGYLAGQEGSDEGKMFDDSSKRGGFDFVLGEGKVIKGWEAGVATMRVGEKSELLISSRYGYGRRGMPPVIPGGDWLRFVIELESFEGGQDAEIKKVKDFNPGIARTPTEIDQDYKGRRESNAERKKNKSFMERFYFISPFMSQTGEQPPWWINPNITFSAIAVGILIGVWLVIKSGAVHVGYVDQPVDVNIFK